MVGATCPFCVVGMGRLGGAEMSYASDLDVLFVFDDTSPGGHDGAEAVAEALLRFVHGPSPAQRVATLDLGLRPEGGQGRLARDLPGYATYFDRWAETWERQALPAGPGRRRRPRPRRALPRPRPRRSSGTDRSPTPTSPTSGA